MSGEGHLPMDGGIMTNQPAVSEVEVALPEVLPGHWSTVAGRDKAALYVGLKRSDLCKGDMSDMELANAVFLVNRCDLSLIHYQDAAKERIRWLSAQLAALTASANPQEGVVSDVFSITLPSEEGVASARKQDDGRFEVWVAGPGHHGGGYRSAWNLASFEAAVRNIMDVLWEGCLPFEGTVHQIDEEAPPALLPSSLTGDQGE